MLRAKGIKSFLLLFLVFIVLFSLNVFPVTTNVAAEETYVWGPLGGTDDLGRTLPQSNIVGETRSDKKVALFYLLWQGSDTGVTDGTGSAIVPSNYDLTNLVAAHPEILNDINDPNWITGIGSDTYYFWGQSVYGYYKGNDYWVHLRNVQLLTDAGVDILVLDASNGGTYSPLIC